MKCMNVNCQVTLLEGAKFCNHCGTPAVSKAKCRHCGEENDLAAKFCKGCGKPMGTVTAVSGAPATAATEAAYASTGGEFLFELTEEEMSRRTSGKKVEPPPLGCVAVNILDGRVQWVTAQKAMEVPKGKRPNNGIKEDNSGFLDLLSRGWRKAVEWVTGPDSGDQPSKNSEAPTIKPNAKSRTFIMMNVQDLPLLRYEHPTPMPGLLDSRLGFSFWVRTPLEYERKKTSAGEEEKKETPEDAKEAYVRALEVFFARVVGTRTRLTVSELLSVASSEAARFVKADQALLQRLQDRRRPDELLDDKGEKKDERADLNGLVKRMRDALGIDGECVFHRGAKGRRQYLDISKAEAPQVWRCSCGESFTKKVNFCGKCRNQIQQPGPSDELILQIANREQVTLRISLLVDASRDDRQVLVDRDALTHEIAAFLGPTIRRLTPDSLAADITREMLSNQLNAQFYKDKWGHLSEFRVEGLWTTRDDWMFQKDAQVAQEEREIEHLRRRLGETGVEAQKLDLRELHFAMEMRNSRQLYRQQTDRLTAELEDQRRREAVERRDEIARRRDLVGEGHESSEVRASERDLERREQSVERQADLNQRRDELDYGDKSTEMRVSELDLVRRAESVEGLAALNQRRDELDRTRQGFDLTVDRESLTNRTALRLQALEVESRRQSSAMEVDEHTINADADLKKEGVDASADRVRFEREQDRAMREREGTRTLDRSDREYERERLGDQRQGETEQLGHEMRLEKDTLKHDLELSDLTLDADRRKRSADREDHAADREQDLRLRTAESEQDLRLRVAEREKLGHIDEDLKDREARRRMEEERQDLEHSKWVIEQQAQAEIAKRNAMQGMDAAQMLAMQAAELAKSGAAVDIFKSVFQSQAEASVSSQKEELYKQMLVMQREANQATVEAHREAARIAQSTGERAMDSMAQVSSGASVQTRDAYREAAAIAQSTNEKSMDSMARAASRGAQDKVEGFQAGVQASVGVTQGAMQSVSRAAGQVTQPRLACLKCGSLLEPADKFCMNCGEPPNR